MNIIKKSFTIKDLQKVKNGGGATLKNYQNITYKTGYQVATSGIECNTLQDVWEAVCKFSGCCGIWYEGGIYYIDKSKRINTLKKAMQVAKIRIQHTILRWCDMICLTCIYKNHRYGT